MAEIYKQIPNTIEGLECSRQGHFRLNGKEKKAQYCYTVIGKKATVRITCQVKGKTFYWQAGKLIARTWIYNYKNTDYIIYKDGDCHNIKAENLIVTDKDGYYEYMRRNSIFKADTLEERKRKLQLVIDEAGMTLHYFKTLDIEPINRHVKEYLYSCLIHYAQYTLHISNKETKRIVPEVLGTMYERIIDGMCLYNYERFCKKLLLDYKKTGKYITFWQALCKPVKIEIEQLNLDCLWEKYKVTQKKNNQHVGGEISSPTWKSY